MLIVCGPCAARQEGKGAVFLGSAASRKFYDFFCGLSKEAIFPDALGIVALHQQKVSIILVVSCFCQAFATGEPEDTAIPAPDAAAALVGAPFIQASVHH